MVQLVFSRFLVISTVLLLTGALVVAAAGRRATGTAIATTPSETSTGIVDAAPLAPTPTPARSPETTPAASPTSSVAPSQSVTHTVTAPPSPGQSPPATASPTATPLPATASPSPAPPPRTATIAFTGDLIPHTSVMRAADEATADGWDFRPMFDDVRPILSGTDLAICHLESPISADDTDLGAYPTFNGPRALVSAIADAGYDGCSTASNHSFDRGADGVHATLDAFDAHGLLQAGMARSADEDRAPVLHDANGITVAHLSATYWLNGFEMPSDEPWLVDLVEPTAILAEARDARAAGAEFVVLSLHAGTEYESQPSVDQVRWVAELLPSPDIDMVVGHHAHVVQPIDVIDDEWVVYGLGNFLSSQSDACCTAAAQDGVITTVSLQERDDASIAVVGIASTPTWVDRAGGFVIRVATAPPPRPDLAAALADSAARTVAVVGSRLGEPDGVTFSSS
ncbi:MAG TPA: CapA family protein [Nitriliruptoraceae bacterium]|nr:CapA family protein [Nitriliruptoraceae bacterium]